MNFRSVSPEENAKFAELCLLIIAAAEKTRDYQAQSSLDVVQAIKILDTSKINEVALSAFISAWQTVGKGNYPAKISEILDGLTEFSTEVSDAVSLFERSKTALESLDADYDGLKEYVVSSSAGKIAIEVVNTFLEQNVDSVQNQLRLIDQYLSALKNILEKVPYFQRVYASNSDAEIIASVFSASAGIKAIDEKFSFLNFSDIIFTAIRMFDLASSVGTSEDSFDSSSSAERNG